MGPYVRLQVTLAVAIAMLALPPTASSAEYVTKDTSRGGAGAGQLEVQYRPDRILMKPKKGLAPSTLANVHAVNRAQVLRTFDRIGDLQVVRLPAGADVMDFIARYQETGLFEYVEPDYMVHALVTEPDDPYYQDGTLWGLNNTGQNGGTDDADIDAPEGWDIIYDASNTVVAVIDSGVRYTHEDLADNMWENPGEIPGNGEDDDQNGYIDDVYGINAITGSGDPMDDFGHGTHCSGTIGGVGNNGLGVVGVAWQVQIMVCKFLDAGGSGSTSGAIESIDYARAMGADILSNSWGGTSYSQALKDAIASIRDDGIIFVAAAGNSTENTDLIPHYPSVYDLDNVVSVAATDRNDQLASFSNYGPWSVDLAAPGVDITSCINDSDSSYLEAQGTSMAAPHVSGVFALLREWYDEDTYLQLIARLLEGTDELPSLLGKCQTDGRLNLHKALTVVPPDLYVMPRGDLSFGGMVGGPFRDPQTYTLVSFSDVNLDWTATNTEDWLTVSPSSGTLGAGGSAVVTVSINENAETLPAGTYNDVITFTNLTSGSGDTTRDVVLTIGPIHVKPDGDDANDGSSWALAKRTVQGALDIANSGQEIWVAAGTYEECILLKSGVGLYGGFAGIETSREQRNPAVNVTTLDADEYDTTVYAPAFTESAVIDSFTIQDGRGHYIGVFFGGGIYCQASVLTITNNIITGNHAEYGGGIGCYRASPTIHDNVITGNSGSYGGGVCCYDSSAEVTNNTIVDNYASTGGGIDCHYASPTISNNIIAFNSSGMSSWCSTAILQNNDVYGSTGYDYFGLAPGATDISADPLLVDWQAGDFHLTTSSPCIDAGDDASAQSDWLDIDRQPRIQGMHVDIGADEVQAVATPTFDPDAGYYADPVNVTVSCATPGATIHYTTNGADPTESDPIITSGLSLPVDESMVLKARAWKTDMGPSAIKSAEYTIEGTTGTVATPTFSPDGGTYTSAVTVTIECANPGATIRYTTDGSDPTENSALYTEPITIATTTTLKARAWKAGWDPSGIKSADYVMVDRLYVDKNAPGPTHDGLTWDTAFLTIPEAMAFASSGNEIWVAAETYDGSITVKSGVALYGGFDGTETSLEQRDWDINVTIVNGDWWTTVVTIPSGASAQTRIDGFTVQNGAGLIAGGIACQENSSPVISHNRIVQNHVYDVGGGIYAIDASPTITYNLIDSNTAFYYGGGIMSIRSSCTISHNDITNNGAIGGELSFPGYGGGINCSGSSTPTITYNLIQGNDASGGAGIRCSGSDAIISYNDISGNEATWLGQGYGAGIDCVSSSATVSHNTVTDNYAEYLGGGIYCGGSGNPTISNNTISWNGAYLGGGVCFSNYSSATISNNTITGNIGWDGAGISCNYYASPQIVSNNLYGNSAFGRGGGISCRDYSSPEVYNNTICSNGATQGGGISCETGSSPTVTNNIVAFDSSGIYKDSSSSPTVDSNCVYGNMVYDYKDESGSPWDPPGNISDDPLLASATYGNLHIQPDSPCRDSGDDNIVEAGWLDIDGEQRIQGDHVDMGADESDGTQWDVTPTVVRVSTDGDDANDGSTWPLAKRTVQAAIDALSPDGGEVWVKTGVYNERIVLPSFAYLYGGFDGTETEREQRDWAANVTTLDGQQGGSVVTAETSGYMLSAVDGFTIVNGSGWYGGGMYCQAASPIIANNTITRNIVDYFGGGIYCEFACPVIGNTIIAGNTAQTGGGGIYCTTASPVIVNTTISGNASGEGGGISCYWDSSPTITNTIIAFNASGVFRNWSSPSVSFSDVYGNVAYDYRDESGDPWDPTGTDGNISEDPVFASASYGNLHIQPSSPCVDVGDNAMALAWASYDIDGQDRIQPQGGTVDMGADESDGTIWDVTPLIVRVSSDGDDANDGSTWALAKRTVQAAIDAAAAEGGEVWAREDIYNELITLAPYAHVYGGFAGTETERDQRDWETYVTVLDGQQGGSVVTADSGCLISTIDGFTIRNGNAATGGGISCDGGSPLISNNVITGNTATGFGGGGISCFQSAATITHNTITGNQSAKYGGGIYGNFASPLIVNNKIDGNTAAWNGGGVRCTSGSIVSDNLIIGNSAQRGGGLHSAASTVTNNTIVDNNGTFEGGGIYCSSSFPSIISNNIVAFNSSGIDATFSSLSILSHNDVYGNTEYDYRGIDPGPGDISEDPLFVDLPNDDIHLTSASPCINTGDDNAPGLQPTDMDGQPRINGVVDMGADEYLILRVSPSGDDANDGYSWDAAKRTVQGALDAATARADVWVAAGTYAESNVTLKEGVQLYGGFAGTEVTREARDWVANVTTLDAGGSQSVVIAPDTTTESTIIDGFTITNGNYYFAGGIMCTGSASPTISHNTITGNQAQYVGGGIYVDSGDPKIINNVIIENSSGYNGGGIYCGEDSPSIINNTIAANTASEGGGIHCSVSSATITNNIVAFNSSGIYSEPAGTPVLSYNDVYGNASYDYLGVSPGTGDISADPMLASVDYGDMHIQPDSPCRDAGDNSAVTYDWLDMDGEARIQPAEGTVDIGADESDGTLWEVIIRVSPTGDDANDGSSWELAKRTVQGAIDAGASCQEIWVAAGTYNEQITLNDGVALYGGFAGTETQRDQRDWTTNVTILDGGDSGEVVTISSLPNPITRVDGFTIQNTPLGFGGGIYCSSSSPTIANNTITSNTRGFGGGIYCYSSNPTIEKNTIAENTSDYGGAIYCEQSTGSITNNTITDNDSQSHAGAIYLTSSSTMVANNVISGNSGAFVGGIYCGDGSPSVINNTIVDNSGMTGGGINCGTGSATITNNIVAFNKLGYGVYNPGGTPTLTYNDAYENQPANYEGLMDPTGMNGNISANPRLASVPYGNLHIQPDSPCRDAGDNNAVDPGWLDMDGEPRIQPVDGTVDIGADESDGTLWERTPIIIRVSPTGDDANDGSTWPLAKRTVQAGIDAAATGEEVWVAAGTYEELTTLKDSVALYGGFAGNETERDQRDPAANVTTLDAKGLGSVVRVATDAGRATLIDGFTITGGATVFGAGIYCYGPSPTIANNTITGNDSAMPASYNGSGGGIYIGNNSNALIEKNTIDDNQALYGGGIYVGNSTPEIVNNVISNNDAIYDAFEEGYGGYGGGIYLTNSAATILNNTIVGNTRNNTIGGIGGGIYCDSESPDIVNNIIAFNTDGISVEGSGTPALSYNDLYGNTEYDYYGVTPGTGDISAHPQFVDQAGDDYHLLSTSPCIDAGTNEGVPPTDKDGNPRVQDGDGDGTDVCDMGAYEYQPDLALMKESRPDGAEVEFGPVSVTITFLSADPSGKNWVYVEQTDRSSGIRVNTMSSFSIGDLVTVMGTIETDTANGERYVQAYPDQPQYTGSSAVLGSLGMRNEWLGGEASGYIPVLRDGFGFYNVGLLVQSWGKVTFVNPAGGYFYINDGSNLVDGSWRTGVRVIVPSGVSMPSYGDYVKATGISSAIQIASQYVRVIRVRTQSDIETVTVWDDSDINISTGWNQLALPGIPKAPHPESVFVGCVEGISLNGKLKRYDALDQAWVTYYSCGNSFGNCLMADGFSLYIYPWVTPCYYYERTPVSGDQLVSLPRGSDPIDYFSFIGNPFDYSRPWSSCTVTDGRSVISLPGAASVGWIHEVEYWDGSAWQEVTDLATGDMDARKGYKIYPAMDNIALTVPQ